MRLKKKCNLSPLLDFNQEHYDYVANDTDHRKLVLIYFLELEVKVPQVPSPQLSTTRTAVIWQLQCRGWRSIAMLEGASVVVGVGGQFIWADFLSDSSAGIAVQSADLAALHITAVSEQSSISPAF